MKLATSLPYAGGIEETVKVVADLEQAGLDQVWVAEAYGFDGVSIMGYLAARTERVEICAGILPIYTRTPSLLAITAAGLDYVSQGRFVLGLGASGPQVIEGFHGVPYDRPLGRTREIVEICRSVWRRERVQHDGPIYHLPVPPGEGTGLGKPLKMITHPVRDRIPIYIASLGPKNVRMTAEIADGWLPLFFVPEEAPGVWGDDLAAGRSARSDELGPLEVVAGGLLSVGEDAGTMVDMARPMVALYVGGMGAKGRNFYNDLVKRYGYEAEAEEIQDLYLDGKKDEAAAKVPRDLLERTNLCGPEGFVRERLAAMAEAGVTVVNVTPFAPDPVKLVEQVKGWIEDL